MMASNDDQESLDGTQCPICFESFRDPKGLECLHTFCESCIHEYIIKLKEERNILDGIECPLCRHITIVKDSGQPPETWAKSLRPNYALVSILETMKSAPERQQTKEVYKCFPCSAQDLDIPASVYCNTCKEHQCDDCQKCHDRFSYMKGHEIINVEPGIKQTGLKKLRKICQCDIHAKDLEFLCKDENVLCCGTCAIVKHRKCDSVIEISEMASSDELRHLDVQKEVSDVRNQVLSVSKFLTNSEDLMTSQIKALPDLLKETKDKFVMKFDEFSAKILNDAEKIKQQKSAAISAEKQKCKEIGAKLNEVLETVVISQYATPFQAYILHHRLNSVLKEIDDKKSDVFKNLKEESVKLEFVRKLVSLVDFKSHFGSVHVDSKFKHPDTVPDYRVVSLSAENNHGGDGSVSLISGIDFIGNGKFLVVNNKLKSVDLRNDKLEVVAKYQFDFNPRDVLALSEDEFAITRSFGIEIFSIICSNSSIMHKSTISTTTENYSLSRLDDDHFVVGVFNNTKPAIIVSRSGTEEHINLDFPLKQYDIKTSQCLVLNTEDGSTLFLAMNDENAIYVYDLAKNTCTKVTHPSVIKPCHMCVGLTDTIFVSCYGSHKIAQISQQGKVLSVLDAPRCPKALSYSRLSMKMILSASDKPRSLHSFNVC
ncbi:tripartite motif-containing protein 5-like [Mercenaria mercenaria]|uniref:tripartite motif-containing protein 5-like n=1 Tax=Mercenaria mercenaria TaxID=6596 RepID=UPI00234EC30E|nr:tripartite motif-containing protein 5-like [Mercenaria mercenaria]